MLAKQKIIQFKIIISFQKVELQDCYSWSGAEISRFNQLKSGYGLFNVDPTRTSCDAERYLNSALLEEISDSKLLLNQTFFFRTSFFADSPMIYRLRSRQWNPQGRIQNVWRRWLLYQTSILTIINLSIWVSKSLYDRVD